VVKGTSATSAQIASSNHDRVWLDQQPFLQGSVGTDERLDGPQSYSFHEVATERAEFVEICRNTKGLEVVMNSNHSIHRTFYRPLRKREPRLAIRFELLLLALSRAASAQPEAHESFSKLLKDWSNTAAMLLEESD
jgi:hypothetical protein